MGGAHLQDAADLSGLGLDDPRGVPRGRRGRLLGAQLGRRGAGGEPEEERQEGGRGAEPGAGAAGIVAASRQQHPRPSGNTMPRLARCYPAAGQPEQSIVGGASQDGPALSPSPFPGACLTILIADGLWRWLSV